MTPCPFRTGDIVVLKTGTAPQSVVDTKFENGGWWIRARYFDWFEKRDEVTRKWRIASDYKPYNNLYIEQENSPMPKLYQTLETTPRFGTLLAKNSVGQLVLEMKGSNQVEAFERDKVEEVKPYTILVEDIHTNAVLHFTCAKDKVIEGDFILLDIGRFVRVKAINTGYAGQVNELKGRKLLTQEL